MANSVQIAVRMSPELAADVERVARLSPVPLSSAAVVRAAIERGLPVLERELTGKPRKGSARNPAR